MQTDYGQHGFTSIPINIQDDWDVIKLYARQYPGLYLKDNGSFWNTYKQTNAVPLNYAIDTAGIVRYVAEGWNEAAVRAVIEQYLPDRIEHHVGVVRSGRDVSRAAGGDHASNPCPFGLSRCPDQRPLPGRPRIARACRGSGGDWHTGSGQAGLR